jgi:predicted secreted Zn-dependent protease
VSPPCETAEFTEGFALIVCERCRQPVPRDATTCPHCGQALDGQGLSLAASAMVVVSVCAVLLFGGVTFAVREQGVAQATASPSATPAAVAAAPSATPRPSAAAGTYLVGEGESVFSVAEATGIDANLLIYWNADRYPDMTLSPALTPGWVLQLSGPMPPTPSPKPTSPPRTQSSPYPIPSLPPVAGLPTIPTINGTMFSGATVVHTYEINGITPHELAQSISTNGPYDPWTGGHAEATTQTHVAYQFRERTFGGSCQIVADSSTPISLSYVVTIPHWAPPPGATATTRQWWIDELLTTVHHENHHVEIWQSYLPAFNDAVLNSTCDGLAADLAAIVQKANTENCQFDMDEYGAAAGLRLEDCLAAH